MIDKEMKGEGSGQTKSKHNIRTNWEVDDLKRETKIENQNLI